MQPAFPSALESWSLPIPVTVALLLAAFVYLRGWLHLRRTVADPIPAWRTAAFCGGIVSVWIAIASPLSALDEELLSVHMAQHLLLMTVAPPLLWLGAPALPLLHGLPQSFSRRVVGPILRSPAVQWIGRVVTEPLFCWLTAILVLLGWHLPAAYSLALESPLLHEIEHASFLAGGLLFWWPVIAPWPSVARYSGWSIVVYLFLATLPCDALSAYLAFCDRVVYSSYLREPRHFNFSSLQDQQFAGALMWVFVTFAYLIPAVLLTLKLLSQAPPKLDAKNELATPWVDGL
jgi:putative membrane protein